MAKYIQYDLENIEEIKISQTVSQSDTKFSRSYITGATIKGAFISKYIKNNKVQDLNVGKNKDLLLKGGIKFLNAFPLVNRTRTVPFPKCYYALKDDIKKSLPSLNIVLSENMQKDKNYQKIKKSEFVLINDERTLSDVKISKKEYLHIRKPESQTQENQIFRYEVIKSNSKFRGFIKIEKNFEEDANSIIKILEGNDFYIGGSKGSGYGLCKFSNVKLLNKNPEYEYFEKTIIEDEDYYEDIDKIYVYALSDIIYRNKLGKYSTILDEDFVAQKIGVDKVTVNNECYIETEYFTSFNNKWGYRQPIVSGIKAGSIISYNIDSGEIDIDKLTKFMDEGIGERKKDGFGRFVILSSLEWNKLVESGKENNKVSLISLNKEKSSDMQLILSRIYKAKIDSTILNSVLTLQNNLKGKDQINSNQWGKLFRLMNILSGLNKTAGINKVNEYFDHIQDKQRNRDLANALDRINVNNKKLKDYIRDQLAMSKEDFYRSYGNKIELGQNYSNITDEEVYKYNVKILKELFRLNLRK